MSKIWLIAIPFGLFTALIVGSYLNLSPVSAITESESTFMSPTYPYSEILMWVWIVSGLALILFVLYKIVTWIYHRPQKSISKRWPVLFLTIFILTTISLILDIPSLIYWSWVGSKSSNNIANYPTQSYVNSTFGFKFDYPADWKIENSDPAETGSWVKFSSSDFKNKFAYAGGDWPSEIIEQGAYIYLRRYNEGGDKTLDILEKNPTKYSHIQTQLIAGKKGLLVVPTVIVGNTDIIAYFLGSNNDSVLELSMHTTGNEFPRFRTVFNQIISSIQTLSVNPISQDKAVSLVWNLPEVQDFQKRVKNNHVVFDHEDQNSFVIHVYENLPDHLATFNWYDVNKTTGEISKEFNY